MLQHCILLLDAGMSKPNAAVLTLGMISDAEKRTLVHDWNDTHAPWREDACIHHLFEEQVK